MAPTAAGEDRAWEVLSARDPAQVCSCAGVGFDQRRAAYRVPSFGRDFTVGPTGRLILGTGPEGEGFLERHAELFRLSLLWYLARATPARPSGNLVNPESLSGGALFSKGSHVLPLAELAAKFATRPAAFLAAGAALDGRPAVHADAAIVLSPLPKVPVTVLLWAEDDEFPARAGLLFDATAPLHLPPDILWSVAMLTLQLLQEPAASGRPRSARATRATGA